MSYLDNIKALASELANMSPKTQMELIKLCKDLCINTKNYLVAFDETTLPAIDARIDALETLTTNLSNELDTAESNIQANANAIATIQDTITTIQTALSNVYTKSQIDTMLASYYTKSQIDTMFASYYNKTEVDNALSGKASLSNDNTFTGENTFNADVHFNQNINIEIGNDILSDILDDKASLTSNNNFSGQNTFSGGSRSVRLEAPSDLYFSDSEKDFEDYMGEKQDELISGTNIKTINNTSLLGSGNINVGAQLYQHTIIVHTNVSNFGFSMVLTTRNNTPFTINTFKQFLIDNADKHFMCNGRENFEGYIGGILAIRYDSTEEDYGFTIMNTNGSNLDVWNFDDNVYNSLNNITLIDDVISL